MLHQNTHSHFQWILVHLFITVCERLGCSSGLLLFLPLLEFGNSVMWQLSCLLIFKACAWMHIDIKILRVYCLVDGIEAENFANRASEYLRRDPAHYLLKYCMKQPKEHKHQGWEDNREKVELLKGISVQPVCLSFNHWAFLLCSIYKHWILCL